MTAFVQIGPFRGNPKKCNKIPHIDTMVLVGNQLDRSGVRSSAFSYQSR
jgi:hypothetical protein